jgi:hypothetical protein
MQSFFNCEVNLLQPGNSLDKYGIYSNLLLQISLSLICNPCFSVFRGNLFLPDENLQTKWFIWSYCNFRLIVYPFFVRLLRSDCHGFSMFNLIPEAKEGMTRDGHAVLHQNWVKEDQMFREQFVQIFNFVPSSFLQFHFDPSNVLLLRSRLLNAKPINFCF